MYSLESSHTLVILGLGMGLAANLAAEAFLAHDAHMRLPFASLDRRQRAARLARWGVLCVALAMLAWLGTPLHTLVLIALLGITAATDAECRVLPPDAFVYGAAAAGVLAHGFASGLPALADAAIAQAMCFSLTTLSVLLFRNTDPGDIKAMMQFGAACGSLPAVFSAVMGQALVAAVLVAFAFVIARRVPRQLPLATLAWAGLVLAAAHAGVS